MNFTSQICTTKIQSERLLALGLKKETADIVIRPDNTLIVINENSFIYHNLEKATQEGYLPAWSLHRLIEMIPKQVKTPKPTYGWVGEDLTFRMDDDLYIQYEDWGIENEEYRFCGKGFYNSNLYDNIIECIEWLIKEDYFNREYLEE